MKDIFSLFNEQNPPEVKPNIGENVVMRSSAEDASKVVEKEPAEEPKAEQTEQQKQEQATENKEAETAETVEKGGVENVAV